MIVTIFTLEGFEKILSKDVYISGQRRRFGVQYATLLTQSRYVEGDMIMTDNS